MKFTQEQLQEARSKAIAAGDNQLAGEIEAYMDAPTTVGGRIAQTVDDIGRSLAQGATFGFADEISAGLGALPALVPGGETFADKYEQNLAYQRARNQEVSPFVQLPFEMAGGIGTAMAAAPFAPASVVSTLNKVPRTVKLALGGGAGGGLAGFGSGEGGLSERVESGLIGMGIGGVAAPAVGMVSPIARQLGARAGPARARIQKTISDMGMTPRQAETAVSDLGEQARLVDVADPMRQQAFTSMSKSPAAARAAMQGLEERAGTATDRLLATLDDTMTTRNYRRTEADLLSRMRNDAKPFYEAAAQASPKVRSSIADDLLDEPGITKVVNKVRRDTKGASKWEDYDHRLWDEVYKELNSQYGKVARPGVGKQPDARRLSKLNQYRADVRDLLTRDNPDYEKALSRFSDPAGQKEILQRGKDFMKGDADVTNVEIGQMSSEMRELFIVGAAKSMRDMANKGELTRNISRYKMAKLRNAFADDEAFAAFVNRIETEREFARTRQKVGYGSPTAERLTAMQDLGGLVAETAAGAPVDVGRIARMLPRMLSGEMTPAQNAEVVRRLMTTDPRLVQNTLYGTPIPGGMSTPIGASIGLGTGLGVTPRER